MADEAASAIVELISSAARFGVSLDSQAAARLRTFVDTLLFWRDRLSLTGAATAREILFDHVLDSLHVCSHLTAPGRLADLGSGAGFPGVPIAIACPAIDVVLVESRRKRASFLREVVRQTGLPNAQVCELRTEQLASTDALSFDAVTARAFGPTKAAIEAAYPLLKPGGTLICMKGPSTRGSEEIRYAGFASPQHVDYGLPSGRTLTLVMLKRSVG